MYSKSKAGCILINSNWQILVVHEIFSDFWGFPKGGMIEGETSVQTALRELEEETGIIMTADNISLQLGKNRGSMFVIFCNDVNCTIDNREIDAYRWVSLEELKKLKTSKFTQTFFHSLNTFLTHS